MALPASGTISMFQVATELGIAATGLSLNDSRVRNLAGKASGMISMSDLHGKSSVTWHEATYTFVPGHRAANAVSGTAEAYGIDTGIMGPGRMTSQTPGSPDLRYALSKANNANTLEIGHTDWVRSSDKYITVPVRGQYHLTTPGLNGLTVTGVFNALRDAANAGSTYTITLKWLI